MTRRVYRPNTTLPAPISGVGVLGLAVLVAPLIALAWAAPWPRTWSLLTAPAALQALWLSLSGAFLATVFFAGDFFAGDFVTGAATRTTLPGSPERSDGTGRTRYPCRVYRRR